MLCPCPTFTEPSFQLPTVSRFEVYLEWLWLRYEASRYRVAFDGVEFGSHVGYRCRFNMERKNEASEYRIQLAVGDMVPYAVATTGAVGEMLCSAAHLRNADETIGNELHRRFEVVWVVVCCPHVL